MKKLLKAILPPFVGFLIYFLGIRYSSLYFTLRFDEMGMGNLVGFMAYYRYTLPLLFADAVLTQLLIVIPVWNNVFNKSRIVKANVCIDVAFICLLFAFGISYAIWDVNSGIEYLLKTMVFLTSIQLIYWAINLYVLKLLK